MVSNAGLTTNATEYSSRLDEYKENVSRLFPMLPKDSVDAWSISEVDILALGLFLECFPQDVVVLNIGTFVGASAFFFASHPKVNRVVSIDPNPTVADEINDKSEVPSVEIDPEPLRNLKVLDVARAVLAEFPNENRKIHLYEGTVGTNRVGIEGNSSGSSEKLDTPTLELSGENPLVAFVGGLHTSEGVQGELDAIFEHNPRAVAILDDCRHTWGPFVQAGVVGFMEGSQQEYGFRLLGDLGPGVATSKLGIVYPKVDGAEVQRALAEFAELFTERLDLLRLLRREEELVATVNRYKDAANDATRLQERNAWLEEQNSHLKEDNSQLREHNSKVMEHNSQLKEANYQLKLYNAQLKENNSHVQQHNSHLKERLSQVRERLSQVRERSTGLEEQISQLEQRSARLEERNLELRKENAQFAVYRSSRRHKIADAVAQKLRWLPNTVRRTGRSPEQ